jgi:hypothetical protein
MSCMRADCRLIFTGKLGSSTSAVMDKAPTYYLTNCRHFNRIRKFVPVITIKVTLDPHYSLYFLQSGPSLNTIRLAFPLKIGQHVA